MDMRPRCFEAVERLLHKGVDIPNPLSIDIGPEVDLDRISGNDVTIYPGCRIYGAKTVISPGVRLGEEAPATLDDCRLGPAVALKGGYFQRSVFLERSSMGSGAQARAGTLLEEEASGAHCVGLKQTILFPFVTLGSLVNFCDCLMAGGTSRKDHGEVGSSYIHFNFTPDGNKATASLFGDVPRGVMLNQPPVFLGGQGGTVGPVRTGFGTVVAAGSVLRDDVPADGMFVMTKAARGIQRPLVPTAYPKLAAVVSKNLGYLANLVALEQWYTHVRRPFFGAQELGVLVYEGALEVLAGAKRERATRLAALVSGVEATDEARIELHGQIAHLLALFEAPASAPSGAVPSEAGADAGGSFEDASAAREEFLAGVRGVAGGPEVGYLAAIRQLPPEVADAGVRWLQRIVDDLCAQARSLVPAMKLFEYS